jgi:hypothetical protein
MSLQLELCVQLQAMAPAGMDGGGGGGFLQWWWWFHEMVVVVVECFMGQLTAQLAGGCTRVGEEGCSRPRYSISGGCDGGSGGCIAATWW